MSYAQAIQTTLFITSQFTLAAKPGVWVLNTNNANGKQSVSFSSCSYPSIYSESGLSYWYSSTQSDYVTINWSLCVGPESPLPAFPWSTAPSYYELLTYLSTNRIAGHCEGGGSGTMQTIYTGNSTVISDRIVEQDDKKLAFKLTNPNSTFTVSKDGTTFPTNATRVAILHIDSDNFLATGEPGVVLGRQDEPGTNGGKSSAIQISNVTGQRAILALQSMNLTTR